MEQFVPEFTKFVKSNYLFFNLILQPEFNDVRDFKLEGWNSTPNYTYLLDLDRIRSVGLAEYVGKKVRNIIKYAKEELTIKEISASEFFQCYKDTYSRQNRKSPKPELFFKELSTLENVKFLGAFKENNLTSGIVVCNNKETAYFVTAGTLTEFHNSNGVTLLLYSYIEELLNADVSIEKFDLVGANNKNISHFKTFFKPDLELYFSLGIAKPLIKTALKLIKTIL